VCGMVCVGVMSSVDTSVHGRYFIVPMDSNGELKMCVGFCLIYSFFPGARGSKVVCVWGGLWWSVRACCGVGVCKSRGDVGSLEYFFPMFLWLGGGGGSISLLTADL